MVEEKKTINIRMAGELEFIPLTFKHSIKGEIGIRDEDGKEISLNNLWGKHISYKSSIRRWVNLDLTLLDYDEKKDNNLIKEIEDEKRNNKDYIDENTEENYLNIDENTEENANEDVKIITKTERGTLFVRPYSFMEKLAFYGDSIIGYRPSFHGFCFGGFDDPNLISLSQLLEKFIGRKVILTLRMEALDEDEEEEDFL